MFVILIIACVLWVFLTFSLLFIYKYNLNALLIYILSFFLSISIISIFFVLFTFLKIDFKIFLFFIIIVPLIVAFFIWNKLKLYDNSFIKKIDFNNLTISSLLIGIAVYFFSFFFPSPFYQMG